MEIAPTLPNYFCQQYNIDANTFIKIEKIKARKLIVFNRIDIIAKLKYIEFREKGFDMGFVKELYKKHIEALRLETFSELGDINGDFSDKYFEKFNQMIDDVKENGFDDNQAVIPVGANNTILEGGHITAIAAYFDLEVSVAKFQDLHVDYGTEFFRKRLLDEKYLNYLVTEYCKLKENVFFACIWPRAKDKSKFRDAENIMNNATKIVYSKSVSLNYQGLRNFMVQIYASEHWIGNIENRFKGVIRKADACFEHDGSIKCFVLECENHEKLLKMKWDIRSIFQIGDHSIHITDNQVETIQTCNLLLNDNTIDFLNNGKPEYYKEFYKTLNTFKYKLRNNNYSLEDFIISSSSIMGLYGLREPNDITFMTVSKEFQVIEVDKINNYHDCINFYGTTIDDLVLNPSNYFFYNDLKFITLDTFKKFKHNRNEKEDQLDIKLINSALNSRKTFYTILMKIYNWNKRRIMTWKQQRKENVGN